ncbi:MAG: hypothetical protein ACI33S_03915 [Bacilli bacterium]
MINYETFMTRYSSLIVGKLDRKNFDSLKLHVKNNVINVISFYGYNDIDVNKCTEGVMLYLLKNVSCDKILEVGYEEAIENAVIRYYDRFCANKVKNNNNDLKPINARRTIDNKQFSQNDKQMIINYIKNLISNYMSIFKSATNINRLCEEVYELLVFNKYSLSSILTYKCDNKIIDFIREREKYGTVEFNDDFNDLRQIVLNTTQKIFSSKQNLPYSDVEFRIFSNKSYMHELAFRVSLALYTQGYNKDNVDYNKIDNFILKDIDRLTIEARSVRRQADIDNRIAKANYKAQYESENKEEIERKRKKKRIIIGIIVAAFILDNLVYKAVQSFKDDEPKKNNKHPQEYSIKPEKQNNILFYDSDRNEMTISDYYNNSNEEALDGISR